MPSSGFSKKVLAQNHLNLVNLDVKCVISCEPEIKQWRFVGFPYR